MGQEASKTHTVLIVDDEPSILVSLEFILEQAGYQVIQAQSGEEALEAIMKYRPDAILLDIMLPGIDGYEVCKITKSSPEWMHIKILFLTAKSLQEDIDKGMYLGGDAYITKPFSKSEILQHLQNVLH